MDFDSREFERAVSSILVPQANLSDVMRRGRYARRRIVLKRATLFVLVAGVVASSLLLIARFRASEPPIVNVPNLLESSDAEDAKAITFAFHALNETGEYVWDYKGFTVDNGVYRVRFLDGTATEELLQRIEADRAYLDSIPEQIEEFQAEATQVRGALERLRNSQASQKRIERKQRELDGWLNEIRFARTRLEAGHEQLRDVMDELRESIDRGGANDLTLTVTRTGDTFTVSELAADSDTLDLDDARRRAILVFEERVPERASGMEYFDPELEGNTVSVRAFWAGPIPLFKRLDCEVAFYAPDGTLIYRQEPLGAESKILPASSPALEDARDGSMSGFTLERVSKLDVARDELEVRGDCRTVTGNYEALGEAFVTEVKTGEDNESTGIELIPGKHVWVNTQVQYVGRPLNGSTVCLARVFDSSGSEIGRHGMTLYQMSREYSDIQIAVDVGDAELVSTATVECRPAVPGIPPKQIIPAP